METRVINKHVEACEVSIGRDSMFGNPYSHQKGTNAQFLVATREEAINKYVEYFNNRINNNKIFRRAVQGLRGKVLGCTCKPLSCHGDTIKDWLDNNPPE